MQTLKCIYTGLRREAMLVKTEYIINCPHMTIELIPGTPLVLEGDFIAHTTFKVSDIRLNTEDSHLLEALFSKRAFKGIGKSKATVLLRTLRYTATDLNVPDFTYLSYEQIIEAIKPLHIRKDTMEKLALFLTGLRARISLYHQIKTFGGQFVHADLLYQKFHTASLEKIKEQPYCGVECGLPLSVCDKIAISQNLPACSAERFTAIGYLFAQTVTEAGNCCVAIEKALSILDRIQNTKIYQSVNSLTILDYLSSYDRIIFMQDDRYGTLVYPAAAYTIELGIAREINRLCQSPTILGFWEYSGSWAPDPDQMKAIGLIRTTGVKIVTGGPGTGKTSVIHEMIREYKKHSGIPGVFLCAPTGAAAARINQSVNGEYHALTVHKLLDVRRFGKDDYNFSYNKKHQLPVGLYILDEMSMVSEELFYKFLLAVPTGSTVILSGDIDQLQSISAGTVLQDLIDACVLETVRLTTVHRQDGQSLIVQNCQHIRNGDGFVEAGAGFTVDLLETPYDRLSKVAEYYKYYRGQCQILTCTRLGLLGKVHLDELITEAHAVNQDQYKGTGFYRGDKVMMVRNNYPAHYFNGDCGIITDISTSQISVQFYEGLLTLTDQEIADMEHAWACTVHKSQGNEYNNVIIVLDPEYPNMLYRSLLFTAVSRARYNVHIISTTQALTKALNDTTEDKRVTGLMGILRRRCLSNE